MVVSFLLYLLPILLFISTAVYLAAYLPLRRRIGRKPLPRHAVHVLLLCYGLSLLYLTVFWYWPDLSFRPEYHFLNLQPFVWVSEAYQMGARKMLEQLLLNIGMFVPFGLLLPMAFARLRRFWRTAAVALLTTLGIETLQYFLGRSADVDDVIMNLAGGMLGYLLYFLLSRLFSGRRWWQQATRTEPSADA